ncbi:MAG: alpha-ketoacid dehydrogenase subunit beta, partial [Wenzhouxiangellaceae bacterium]
LLLAAIRDPDPVVFLEPKRIYRWQREEVEDSGEELPLDVCFVLRDGIDITLVTWGAMIKETMEAADILEKQGVSAEVIDVATVAPIDMETIIESVEKTGRCVIVHEAPRSCGVGAEVAAGLAEKALWHLKAPIRRVTGYDTVMPLYRSEMNYMPSTERIVQAASETMEFE